MNHRELRELLGAYALDAVEDDERAEVEAHLPACARCRAEVQEHREAASLLAFSGGPAPEGLWEGIAASLEDVPPAMNLAPLVRPSRDRSHWFRLAAAALTAAAVTVAVLGFQVRNQNDRIDELETALRDPLVPAFQAALEDPDSKVIELTSADGRISLRGAITPEGTGYIRATSLPALERGRTYQLWGGAADQLISIAVLGPDPEIVSFRADPYSLFAVTEEEAPGVVTSSNPPVVAGSAA